MVNALRETIPFFRYSIIPYSYGMLLKPDYADD